MFIKLLTLNGALAMASAIDASNWHHPPIGKNIPYSPQGAGDVRSPCPGLNTLANHYILPHDGKGYTVSMVRDAVVDTYNIADDVIVPLSMAAVALNPTPNATFFDLDHLDKHNAIEHDASLSRADYYETGDDHTFIQSIFDIVLKFFDGHTHTSISTAAKAKYASVLRAERANPNITYGTQAYVASNGGTAFYLAAMGDPINGTVPVSFVKSFFEKEKLPIKLGWQKSEVNITAKVLANLSAKIANASGEPAPKDSEGNTIGVGHIM